MASVIAAAATKTARHPSASASRLDSGRASRMPDNSPPMMVPTVRPRVASGARCAASGIRICTLTELSPSSSDTSRKGPGCVDSAAATRLAVAAVPLSSSSRRFS
ncbi:hypothetical protein B551_0219840 [Cupriavidus sp. HPC(L)]|nr:hypothetical protein B551_0219840 [Cupriavidus sp. HPC(L)]